MNPQIHVILRGDCISSIGLACAKAEGERVAIREVAIYEAITGTRSIKFWVRIV
jgi:hypothetical protein